MLSFFCIPIQKGDGTVKTYSTGDSLVVTDPATDPALARLSWEIRRDPDCSWRLWSYVVKNPATSTYEWKKKSQAQATSSPLSRLPRFDASQRPACSSDRQILCLPALASERKNR